MDEKLVWNPLFDEREFGWFVEQVKNFYPGALAGVQENLLTPMKGRRFSDVFQRTFAYLQEEHMPIPVSNDMHQRLLLADQAISFAKTHLPFGAGNQLEACCITSGNAKQRTGPTKNVTRFGQKENAKGQVPTGSAALVSLVTQGATCREYAALAYEFLRSREVPAEDLTIWSIGAGDHVLILLGNLEDPMQVVAVDAWPTHAQAVRWQDHFAFRLPRKEKTTIYPGPAGKLVLPWEVDEDEYDDHQEWEQAQEKLRKDLVVQLLARGAALDLAQFTFVPCCTLSFTRITYSANELRFSAVHSNIAHLPELTPEGEEIRLRSLQGKNLSALLSGD